MGIGSESRGDDAAGIKVVTQLRKEISSPDVLFIDGGTVPENYTSKVKKFEPKTVILIDSVHFGEEPGTVSRVDPSEIVQESVSTHRLPLSKLIEYLKIETDAEVILLGIQPENLDIGSGISEKVQKSVDELVSTLKKELEFL